MTNFIIGTCGHIDHGKTSLIRALNGFEGDTTSEEKQRGITIDLSFSNMQKGHQNIAFIDVPGHEKLVKNMIAGAFGFDCVMIVISAAEGIKPQTIEHIEILNLLGVKNAVVVLTKKDLVDNASLEAKKEEISLFLKPYDFNLLLFESVSIYDTQSIEELKSNLFKLNAQSKTQENFFRYYIDRVFSSKGTGTVVTGTVLGKPIQLNDKLYLCDLKKEVKVKNLQVHNSNVLEANISNRAAINLQGIQTHELQRGMLLSKKGYLRGFNTLDIHFNALKNKILKHNQTYTVFIGSKKIDANILLFNSTQGLETGFATIKSQEELFCVFGEKLILRQGNETIAGGVVLNPINDPLKKHNKLKLLEALSNNNIVQAYEILLQSHKKGLGLISSAQRFALSHEEALEIAQNLNDSFIDKKALVLYPLSSKITLKEIIASIYKKNQYALLSVASLALRLKWASENLIESVLLDLTYENMLIKEGNLYKNAHIKEDFTQALHEVILNRLIQEDISPTAPYNIYDDLDIDRKMGDTILKSLCAKKQVIRLQHNLFIYANSLNKIVNEMTQIIKKEGYIDINNFKGNFQLSRKYLITYLDYLDNFSNIKKIENRRVFV
ncbi:MAG: selenocysteine-specific translation elongation factor [Arcobacteraceae bacterium]|jgi:selenocysteine-specific elongation factor|nr:selenocysteine-specific translation elongation factor [Arcobacteraceae bacterium]